MSTVFITGGTGYIGSRLIKALLKDGNYSIQALVRKGSEERLPAGCEIIFGNALDGNSYQEKMSPSSIFIHLVGVPHPSPAKKEAFKKIDLVSVREAIKAAAFTKTSHFIYLSVAMHSTKIMKEFQAIRATGERLLRDSEIPSSFIRPWYVIGPGHYWPLLLKPLIWLLQFIPAISQTAKKLDTVTIAQIIRTLIYTVRNPPDQVAIYEVSDIKKF